MLVESILPETSTSLERSSSGWGKQIDVDTELSTIRAKEWRISRAFASSQLLHYSTISVDERSLVTVRSLSLIGCLPANLEGF